MPFKAKVNDEFVISSFLSENEWKELKKAKPSIKMTCCNAPGYMKRNRYGTQFFAHNSIGNCNYQPESTEHIFLKDKIARICKENEYDVVDVERRGTDWIADVYVEHENKRYALEVQLSKITFDTIVERSEKYIRDGIQPVWILKDRDIEKYCRARYFNLSLDFNNLFAQIKMSNYTVCFKEHGILMNSISDFDGILKDKIKIDTFEEDLIDLDIFISEIISGSYIDKCISEINEAWEYIREFCDIVPKKENLFDTNKTNLPTSVYCDILSVILYLSDKDHKINLNVNSESPYYSKTKKSHLEISQY